MAVLTALLEERTDLVHDFTNAVEFMHTLLIVMANGVSAFLVGKLVHHLIDFDHPQLRQLVSLFAHTDDRLETVRLVGLEMFSNKGGVRVENSAPQR